MTHGSLVGAVVVPAVPVAPGARASAEHTPGGARLSSREVDASSARAAFGDALVAAYMRATSQARRGGHSKAPTQGG